MLNFSTKGVCSRGIELEIENDILMHVKFIGGCDGNTKGVASLAKGMKIDDVIAKLDGIKCGMKSTSCPDQLCIALKQYKAAH